MQLEKNKNGCLLVCLSCAPSSELILREAAEFSKALGYSFLAMFIESNHSTHLQQYTQLAENLGGQSITICGKGISAQIIEYVKEYGVTKILIGITNKSRVLWYAQYILPMKLRKLNVSIDLLIVPHKQRQHEHLMKKSLSTAFIINPRGLLIDIGILSCSILIGMLFFCNGLSEISAMSIMLLGILVAALYTYGPFYGIFNALIGVLTFNFFFVEPFHSFQAYSSAYPVTFIVMFFVSYITNSLTQRIKEQARHAANRAYRTQILLETNQKFQNAENFEQIIQAAAEQIIKLIDCPVVFYAVQSDGTLDEGSGFTSPELSALPDWKNKGEYNAAVYAFAHKQQTGVATAHFANSKFWYRPLQRKDSVLGVVGIFMNTTAQRMESSFLFTALLNEFSAAIERYHLSEAKKQMELKAEQERLRANMLRMISHDLRTPLTSISGNAGILMDKPDMLTKEQQHRLSVDIYDDALWLNGLVENILSITRLESALQLHLESELIAEVFEDALRHVDRRVTEHEIMIDLPDDLLMAKMDAQLIIQVVVNIVNNSIKYSGEHSKITLSAQRAGDFAEIKISDNGIGIPNEVKEKLFSMFYTAPNQCADSRRGLGIGLTLCKSIIALHSGTIKVEDNQPKGITFTFTLPLAEVDCVG